MKITASRRDDVLKRKAEVTEKRERLKSKMDEGEREYRIARKQVFSKIEDEVNKRLSSIKLPLLVAVNYAPYGDKIEVRVDCGRDAGSNQEDFALSWNWRVWLSQEGEIMKDSGSWSGLNACTVEQMNDLKRSIRALEILNEEIDWSSLLSVELPDANDYMDKETVREYYNTPSEDFNEELLDATLEDAMESGELLDGLAVKQTGLKGSGQYQILKVTPKFVEVKFLHNYYKDKGYNIEDMRTLRVAKSTLKDVIKY